MGTRDGGFQQITRSGDDPHPRFGMMGFPFGKVTDALIPCHPFSSALILISSAAMLTAISAGVSAFMERPMGE
jgi:hypothetical protein